MSKSDDDANVREYIYAKVGFVLENKDHTPSRARLAEQHKQLDELLSKLPPLTESEYQLSFRRTCPPDILKQIDENKAACDAVRARQAARAAELQTK